MKTIRKIVAIILILFTIMTSPLSVYFNVQNNVYASATFGTSLESELFKHISIATMISAGLVFKSKEAAEEAVYELKDWLYDQGFDWKVPDGNPEPEGPKIGDIIKTMLATAGFTVFNSAEQIYQSVIGIPQWFWEFMKYYIDENYDVGEINTPVTTGLMSLSNLINNEEKLEFPDGNNYMVFVDSNYILRGYAYREVIDNDNYVTFYEYSISQNKFISLGTRIRNEKPYKIHLVFYPYDYENNAVSIKIDSAQQNRLYGYNYEYYGFQSVNYELPSNIIIGVEDIVDNPDYDWNNQYTGEKDIVIPIQSDLYGNPKVDENGYYLPTIEIEEWVDVQPEEIPLLDPSGVPQPEIPQIPEVENPDDDTSILITIGLILQNLLRQITGIRNDTSTISENTSPSTSGSGTGGIGDGIGDVPTGFEWGDFRHLLDIFFIFIYFIVILILILLKFLQVVFTGLPGIAANTDLFTQYPNILAGVNYVKNLQVGGLSITVHQAFEFVFLIFFYIFIIKQIRKLYNAAVYEESSINHDYKKDMKMDYYDRNNKQ